MALPFRLLWLLLLAGAIPTRVWAFCHEIEVVDRPVLRLAAASARSVEIQWFGHSTFQITSSKGTRILTDPHSRDDLPWPTQEQHIVTTSHQHGAHSNIYMAKGNPAVLEGLTPGGENWRPVSTTIRDVSVYLVPAYHDKSQGLQRGKNAIFVFLLGKIDVLLVPVAGGMFTITPSEAREVTKQVKPKIAIPEHYWWEGAVEQFTQGLSRVRQLNSPILRISKPELPQPTEIVIMNWNHR
jgi:L-ascorbate metabolism protein UlaG (beta-lactamase superfamily)